MKEAERRFGRNVETAVHVLAALPAGGMVGVTMDGNGIPIDLDILEDGASDVDLLEGIGRTADLHGLKRLTVISDCAFENPACLQASARTGLTGPPCGGESRLPAGLGLRVRRFGEDLRRRPREADACTGRLAPPLP